MSKITNQEQTSSLPKIGAPATRALTAAGYYQLTQFAQAKSAELLKIHGVGPKAIRILREALATEGLTFLDEQIRQ